MRRTVRKAYFYAVIALAIVLGETLATVAAARDKCENGLYGHEKAHTSKVGS